jgi:hypothetical protein
MNMHVSPALCSCVLLVILLVCRSTYISSLSTTRVALLIFWLCDTRRRVVLTIHISFWRFLLTLCSVAVIIRSLGTLCIKFIADGLLSLRTHDFI